MPVKLYNVGIYHVFASGAVVGRTTTHEWDRPRTLDTPLGDVPLYYIEEHVKQIFLVDNYHRKLYRGFRKIQFPFYHDHLGRNNQTCNVWSRITRS